MENSESVKCNQDNINVAETKCDVDLEIVTETENSIDKSILKPLPNKNSHACNDIPIKINTSTLKNDSEFNRSIHNRQMIANELLSTEQTYVAGLKILVNQFNNNLLKALRFDPIISREECQIIFRNIDQILDLQVEFVAILKKRIEDQMSDCSSEGTIVSENEEQIFKSKSLMIGDIFLSYKHLFAMYSIYSQGQSVATQTLDKLLNTNSKFKRFCQESLASTQNNDISSYLILPIQRLPRYKLLLLKLIKNIVKTPKSGIVNVNISSEASEAAESNPDYLNLIEADHLIQRSIHNMNNDVGLRESHQAIQRLQEQFVMPKSMKRFDSVKERRFIRQEYLKVHSKHRNRFEFILFDDLFVQAKRLTTRNRFKVVRQISIGEVLGVSELDPDYVRQQFLFIIQTTEKSFVISCDTIAKRQAQMTDIDALCNAFNTNNRFSKKENIETVTKRSNSIINKTLTKRKTSESVTNLKSTRTLLSNKKRISVSKTNKKNGNGEKTLRIPKTVKQKCLHCSIFEHLMPCNHCNSAICSKCSNYCADLDIILCCICNQKYITQPRLIRHSIAQKPSQTTILRRMSAINTRDNSSLPLNLSPKTISANNSFLNRNQNITSPHLQSIDTHFDKSKQKNFTRQQSVPVIGMNNSIGQLHKNPLNNHDEIFSKIGGINSENSSVIHNGNQPKGYQNSCSPSVSYSTTTPSTASKSTSSVTASTVTSSEHSDTASVVDDLMSIGAPTTTTISETSNTPHTHEEAKSFEVKSRFSLDEANYDKNLASFKKSTLTQQKKTSHQDVADQLRNIGLEMYIESLVYEQGYDQMDFFRNLSNKSAIELNRKIDRLSNAVSMKLGHCEILVDAIEKLSI